MPVALHGTNIADLRGLRGDRRSVEALSEVRRAEAATG